MPYHMRKFDKCYTHGSYFSSNVRMKSRRDATRPKTHIRLFDGQTTEWCWAMWKFSSSREMCDKAFTLRSAVMLLLFALSFCLSISLSNDLAHFLSRSIFQSSSLSLSHSLLIFTLFSCARSLSLSLSYSLMLSIPVYRHQDHFPFAISLPFAGMENGNFVWNVCVRVTEETLHVEQICYYLALSFFFLFLSVYAACVW